MIKRIQKEHIQARKIDAAFAKDVHRIFIENLDPGRVYFSKENETQFLANLSILESDLLTNKLTYFNLVKSELDKAIESYNKQLETWKSTQQNLNSSVQFTESEWLKTVDQKSLSSKRSLVLSIDLIQIVLGNVEQNSKSYPKDSLSKWEARAREKLYSNLTRLHSELSKLETLENIYLNAIAEAFDPHTSYFDVSTKKDFIEELSSEREIFGISYSLNSENEIEITRVAPGSSAWFSNQIHTGQKILGVQFKGESKIELTASIESYDRLQKAFETTKSKELTLFLEEVTGDKIEVSLIKDIVIVDGDIIKSALLKGEKKIGYIALPDFYMSYDAGNQLGCANDVAKSIIKLKKDGIDGLVLDLRGNGGGSLKEAIDLCGIFIDFGPVAAIENKGNDVQLMKDFNRGAIFTGPLMVLIDEQSASASELVASTLQDYNRAIVFGHQSYGKATAQNIYPVDPKINDFSSGVFSEDPEYGYVKITNGRLFRITSKTNQRVGVVPSILWVNPDLKMEEYLERNQETALKFDTISKKITFQTGPALNLEPVQTTYQTRLKSDPILVQYLNLVAKYNSLTNSENNYYLNIDKEFNKILSVQAWNEEIKKFRENIQLPYTVESNSFDQELLESNEIIKSFQDEFQLEIKQDMQLIEAYRILSDFITNQNK